MGWENRGGGRYYYRSRRVGGRVVKEYLGAGPVAEWQAAADDFDRAERQAEREEVRALLEPIDAACVLLDELGGEVDAMVTETMTAAGYHRHNRGEWRRRRDTLAIPRASKGTGAGDMNA